MCTREFHPGNRTTFEGTQRRFSNNGRIIPPRVRPHPYLPPAWFFLLLLAFASVVPCRTGFAGFGFSGPSALDYAYTDAWNRNDYCPDIATDGNGMWVVAWRGTGANPEDAADYDLFVSRSTDMGETWSSPYRYNAGTIRQGCPSVATDGDGNWVVAFSSSNSSDDTVGNRNIYALRSTNGLTWYSSMVKGTVPSPAYQRNPKVAPGGGGNWIAVWESNSQYTSSVSTGTDYDIFAAYSSDNGATWSAAEPVNSDASSDTDHDRNPSLVWTGGTKDWIVAWSGSGSSGTGIYWSRLAYGETTWASQGHVTGTGKDSYLPVLTTDRNGSYKVRPGPSFYYELGSLGIAWTDYGHECVPPPGGTCYDPYSRVYTSRYRVNPKGIRYWETPTEHLYHDSDFILGLNALKADGNGNWVLVYDASVNGSDLRLRYSTDYGGTWESGAFAGDNQVRDFPSIATDGSGKWMAVWASNNTLGFTVGGDMDILMATAVPPEVLTIEREGGNPTYDSTIDFQVGFSSSVEGVDKSDFTLTTTGNITNASVSSVTQLTTDNQYRVTVNRGSGTGTIRLDLTDNDTIVTPYGYSLGGFGANNGNFTSGESYTIDVPPSVVGIEREDPNPTAASSTRFRVRFDQWTKGVDSGDFRLMGTASGAAISAVSSRFADNSYIVTVNTGSVDGTIRLDLIDNDSISDDINHPLGGLGLTSPHNGSYTAGEQYTVDRTPPDSTNAFVGSTTGPYTNKDTELTFTWGDFFENYAAVNPIVGYEVALTTSHDFPADGQFTPVGNVTEYTFDASNSTTPFPEVEHVCWVRAVNSLDQKSDPVSGSVTINTQSLDFGGDILAFEGVTWEQVNWQETTLPSTKHAIRIDELQLLITGDTGSFNITWVFTFDFNGDGRVDTNDGYNRQYNTITKTAKTPMVIYHTHRYDADSGGSVRTDLPEVNLGPIPDPKIHHNGVVTGDKTGAERLWKGGLNGKTLYAEKGDLEVNDRHLVILQYMDEIGGTIGYEIVEVKNGDLPDAGVGNTTIGSRLLSEKPIPPQSEAEPIVRRGLDTYIYKHTIDGAPQYGHLWAIEENDPAVPGASYNMEVIWKRKGLYGIVWPWEIRRYTAVWPENEPPKYQLYVRGSGDEASQPLCLHPPCVTIPQDRLYPSIVTFNFGDDVNLYAYYDEANGKFMTNGPGWVLLKYQTRKNPVAGTPGDKWIGFEVIRAVDHHDPLAVDYDEVTEEPAVTTWIVGAEIADPVNLTPTAGKAPPPGYIYVSQGKELNDRYDPFIYDASQSGTGQIFPVNKGTLEVWWYNLSNTEPATGVQVWWPSRVVRYRADWADHIADVATAFPNWQDIYGEIVIARQDGAGALPEGTYGTGWKIYVGEDPESPGFNPNEEHAYMASGTIFALRDDLGSNDTSLPYVLMKYVVPDTNDWAFRIFKVSAQDAENSFAYETTVGGSSPINAPNPIYKLGMHNQNWVDSPVHPDTQPAYMDKNDRIWAKSTGEIDIRYSYLPREDFYIPEDYKTAIGYQEGQMLPWLDSRGSGEPVTVTFTSTWPDDTWLRSEGRILSLGQTVFDPDIDNGCGTKIIYQDPLANPEQRIAKMMDPMKTHEEPLDQLPADLETAPGTNMLDTSKLSMHLRRRVSYDNLNGVLKFSGYRNEEEDYLLTNVMSDREAQELIDLNANKQDPFSAAWEAAVEAIRDASQNQENQVPGIDPEMLALTAGYAEGSGYVTVILQDVTTDPCKNTPVTVKVYKVDTDSLSLGHVITIPADCAFDEKLTVRYTGDFGGRVDDVNFQWYYKPFDPDRDGPAGPQPPYNLQDWIPHPDSGAGAIDISIKGPGEITLTDNWFIVRYQYQSGANTGWSQFARGFGEGWIKRVLDKINPYEQRYFSEQGYSAAPEVNTVVDMVSQAGPPPTADVPLNCLSLDDFGLIEIYETVLKRGIELSIDGEPPFPSAVMDALLLVASRIADLYLLLGNEAYADAADPTIAVGADGTYGDVKAPSSVWAFKGQTASLIEEELSLLRGRDDSGARGVKNYPDFNRLYWNFFGGDGEPAYALNYNITNKNTDNVIDDKDARKIYPQGHGDAWGHYLTALKTYYRLLIHPNYKWQSRPEVVKGVSVDYFDERKFAEVAAAKARTGAEIVNLTYRQKYVEDPGGQWKGYRDSSSDRAWGLSEWGSRAGMGAYLDWVVGNALLPPEDTNPEHTGIQKIDRTTVLELREVASRFQGIQSEVDTADNGLNPLGLATNVIPFDIDPQKLAENVTHFDQMYKRAVTMLKNALIVFYYANSNTQQLRRQAETQVEFEQMYDEREVDFKNRLIQIYGYPYPDDPAAKDSGGPDLINFDIIDVGELLGYYPPDVRQFDDVTVTGFDVSDDGSLQKTETKVTLHMSQEYGRVKPKSWTGKRKAPGEIQMARRDLIQARLRFERALADYDNLLARIEDHAELMEAQYKLNAEEISVLNSQLNEQERLNGLIKKSREKQLDFRKNARIAVLTSNALAEALPVAVGMAVDATSAIRSAIRLIGTVTGEVYTQNADRESIKELDHQQALQNMQLQTSITLTSLRTEFAIQQELKQLEDMIRQEVASRLELYTLQEAMIQTVERYRAALDRGERLVEDLYRFRRQAATRIQTERYKDMAFRIFRNDALQKYRLMFDLAARHVYLAAKAYDFDTTLLGGDQVTPTGASFLADIVRKRVIGEIAEGGEGPEPILGSGGLAGILKQMQSDYNNMRGVLRFNNPSQENRRFSLRHELFRIRPGYAGNAEWRQTLWDCVVPDLFALPEFRRYCVPFTVEHPVEEEPALVIPFETKIYSDLNFFGWPKGGNDNVYSSSHYATRIKAVGVWFSNYNNLGMVNTPYVYLIPVGVDILRSPKTGASGEPREFTVLDQILPRPTDISGQELSNRLLDFNMISQSNQPYASIRKHAELEATHDSGVIDQVHYDGGLIGRSVWNTRWLLIIPAVSLLGEREEGLARFIDGMPYGDNRDGNGVTDIKVYFDTYAYSGAVPY